MSRFPGKKTPIDDVNSKEIDVKRSRKEDSVEQILGTSYRINIPCSVT